MQMLERAEAVRFDRVSSSGKTKPCIMECATEDGERIEAFVKFTAGCERREIGLACEAIAAMLARELNLPCPQSYAVDISQEFLAALAVSPEAYTLAKDSIGWNYGSEKLPPGYSIYPHGRKLNRDQLQSAAEILAFDVLIANPDRRIVNPNLLWNGKGFAIIDHELAFTGRQTISWKPIWEPGGTKAANLSSHVLWDVLKSRNADLQRLIGAFQAITDSRIDEIRDSLPETWLVNGEAVDEIFRYITEVRKSVVPAIENLGDALR